MLAHGRKIRLFGCQDTTRKEEMVQKKVVFFILLALTFLQAFIFLFYVKNKDWKLNNRFRLRRNDSEVVETEARHLSGFNESEKELALNINYRPSVILTTANMSIEEERLSNFSLDSRIITPAIDQGKGDIFLLVLVTTVPKSLERRELIRNTWAKAAQTLLIQSMNATNFTSHVVFMLGITGDSKQDSALEEEATKYGDILRVPCIESYRNIISKVWFAFEWALSYHAKYILKVDDDIYVRLPRLNSWLTDAKVPRTLYAGYVHHRAYIARDPKHQHYVSESEYNEKVFPNYCAGPCYMFSGNLLDKFLELSKSVRKFQVEDAYLGLLAKRAGVQPFDIGGKLFVWDRSLSRSVRQWNDQSLSGVICLGDSLTDEAIKYIHARYGKIEHSLNRN